MLRTVSMLAILVLALGVAAAEAQTKKPAAAKLPTAKDNSIAVNVFLKDSAKNEVLLSTRIWPGYPDYNAIALQRFFATMKALEPAYQQDDQVAYTWATKARVAKCSIYLEAPVSSARTDTGAMVGCEANGVSSLPAPSSADPKYPVSSTQDPKHLADVLEMFKKQSDRAKSTLAK